MAYYLRRKCCLLKSVFYKCIPRGGMPTASPIIANMLHFGTVFQHSLQSHLSAIASPFLPSPPPIPLSQPLPFSKEVNKKLSYHRENALSFIKHTNAIPLGNIYVLYLRQARLARGMCSRLVRSSVTRLWFRQRMNVFQCKFTQVVLGEGHAIVNLEGQEVKGQDHTRQMLDLEAWQIHLLHVWFCNLLQLLAT